MEVEVEWEKEVTEVEVEVMEVEVEGEKEVTEVEVEWEKEVTEVEVEKEVKEMEVERGAKEVKEVEMEERAPSAHLLMTSLAKLILRPVMSSVSWQRWDGLIMTSTSSRMFTKLTWLLSTQISLIALIRRSLMTVLIK